MVADRGRKFGPAIAVECADVGVEGQVGSMVAGPDVAVFDIIPVFPLIPGQVVELEEEALGPLLAGLAAAAGVVVALLEVAPFGREEAF